jgi:tetratricopeptide (TPR) repeat protein
MTDQELPNFVALWNFQDPADTEEKFRALLEEVGENAPADYRLEVMTQIARTLGLRMKFDEAHAVLDEVEQGLGDETPKAKLRYLLERGRTLNSSGKPEEAKPLFASAWDVAREVGSDGLAIDAAHMLGFITDPKEQHEWNLKALSVAEASEDQRVKGWLGPLYHNIGMTYLDDGELVPALSYFMKDYEYRLANADQSTTRIAKWCVAHALRKMERYEPALRMQYEMEKECLECGEPDGFVTEEIGEILLATDHAEEAQPFFQRAWDVLKNVDWVRDSDPDRIERLRKLGTGEE